MTKRAPRETPDGFPLRESIVLPLEDITECRQYVELGRHKCNFFVIELLQSSFWMQETRFNDFSATIMGGNPFRFISRRETR